MLQAKANRYAYIFGGLNSILYAAIYVYAGIYASAASSFFFSFPIQIFTFWNWSKKTYKKSTKFRTMSTKARILSTLGFLAVWAGVLIALTLIGSSLALLDTSASLLGMTVLILTMLAYKEYAPPVVAFVNALARAERYAYRKGYHLLSIRGICHVQFNLYVHRFL